MNDSVSSDSSLAAPADFVGAIIAAAEAAVAENRSLVDLAGRLSPGLSLPKVAAELPPPPPAGPVFAPGSEPELVAPAEPVFAPGSEPELVAPAESVSGRGSEPELVAPAESVSGPGSEPELVAPAESVSGRGSEPELVAQAEPVFARGAEPEPAVDHDPAGFDPFAHLDTALAGGTPAVDRESSAAILLPADAIPGRRRDRTQRGRRLRLPVWVLTVAATACLLFGVVLLAVTLWSSEDNPIPEPLDPATSAVPLD